MNKRINPRVALDEIRRHAKLENETGSAKLALEEMFSEVELAITALEAIETKFPVAIDATHDGTHVLNFSGYMGEGEMVSEREYKALKTFFYERGKRNDE